MNKAFIKKYGTLLLLACAPGFIFQLIILFVLVCLSLVLLRLRRNNSNI